MAFNQFPQKGGIPSGNTAGRPSNPIIGDTYYNGEFEVLEIYNGTNWVANSAPPATPSIASVTDVGTGVAYETGGTLTVVVSPGSGGSTALQYNVSTSAGGFSASSSSTTISLTGLTPATSFVVVASASNNFGTTVNSNPFANTLVTTKPQAPTIGTATASTGAPNQITVTWTLNSNGGKNLSAITITPFLNGTTAGTSRTAATTSSTSYTFTEGQLTANSAYTFKITTTNANGTSLESAASNSATMPSFISVDFLVLAGGGGGSTGFPTPSNRAAGGGGAGGFRSSISPTGGGGSAESTLNLSGSTNYTVTVGAGGAGGGGPVGSGGIASSGSNSVFSTITSLGGGRGAGPSSANSGISGGSGGGGSNGGSGGAGTSGQGFAGGNSEGGNNAGTGGGAGGAGTAVNSPTPPDNGVSNSITGSAVTYAKGGPWTQASQGPAGPANTGQGGAGGYDEATYGQSGGSGIVILRYPDTKTITIGAGLTGSESAASGGYKRATITAGSGNVSWS